MQTKVRNKWKEVIEALETDDLKVIKKMIEEELK